MKRFIGGALGALAGLGFTTMGLLYTGGGITFGGGNEATPVVIAVGVLVGATLGSVFLYRWPLALGGVTLGLACGIWLRDNLNPVPVQPPSVFLLLFGLSAVSATAGAILDRHT